MRILFIGDIVGKQATPWSVTTSTPFAMEQRRYIIANAENQMMVPTHLKIYDKLITQVWMGLHGVTSPTKRNIPTL